MESSQGRSGNPNWWLVPLSKATGYPHRCQTNNNNTDLEEVWRKLVQSSSMMNEMQCLLMFRCIDATSCPIFVPDKVCN
jgi:hypothetical protein